jgi:hypothetical protein
VLRIEMRDACGAEIAISGLTDLIDIAMPLQRSPPTPCHHTLSLPLPLATVTAHTLSPHPEPTPTPCNGHRPHPLTTP